jgi:hypothetical protein
MREKENERFTYYIVVLHPSVESNKKIECLQQTLFSTNHLLDARILPPSIIVGVDNTPIILPPCVHVTPLSTPITFSHIESIDERLYLTTTNQEFHSWFTLLQEQFPSRCSSSPLKSYPGFFLGKKGELSLTSLLNDNWNLASYFIQFEMDGNIINHSQYNKLYEMHLK